MPKSEFCLFTIIVILTPPFFTFIFRVSLHIVFFFKGIVRMQKSKIFALVSLPLFPKNVWKSKMYKRECKWKKLKKKLKRKLKRKFFKSKTDLISCLKIYHSRSFISWIRIVWEEWQWYQNFGRDCAKKTCCGCIFASLHQAIRFPYLFIFIYSYLFIFIYSHYLWLLFKHLSPKCKLGNWGSWYNMFMNKPRLRFGGLYFAKVTYIRPGERDLSNYYSAFHMVLSLIDQQILVENDFWFRVYFLNIP